MRTLLLMLVAIMALLLPACAGSLQSAADSSVAGAVRLPDGSLTADSRERCEQLSDRAQLWGGVSRGSAVLAGAQGIATIPVTSHDAQVALAIGAAVAATSAATASYLESSSAESWARECSAK
jgi:hypothetical protein